MVRYFPKNNLITLWACAEMDGGFKVPYGRLELNMNLNPACRGCQL